ncbi:uncharacterized protein LOC122043144 [Zingiber officinale]|uniref:CUE domain-containing protein n=1 Tax=Zingiber officinale TaxID=94328 RepID=A0A8J5I829_ZINOF|nr:uncharacterized protein LOC122043144 [Zingiber officinale]KAG6530257.1 hypothetical protein ZIOFF_012480 [Zingiber officinale]
MSAFIDCRKRGASAFLDDAFCDSPSLSKRIRLSDTAALLATPSPSTQNPLDLLRARFPDLDIELVQRVFETSGSNLDAAIKNLIELLSSSQGRSLDSAFVNNSVPISPDVRLPSEDSMAGSSSGRPDATSNLPVNRSGCVELLLKELTSAADLNDAKTHASRILELFEKFVAARTSHEAFESLSKENEKWKQQVEVLLHENNILKRAVSIQHEWQRTFDAQNEEVQQLRQMLSQCKEQIRTLEMNNYTLGVHLKVAQQSSSFPGRHHPDVF